MNQYGKILDGSSEAVCMMSDERKFVMLVTAESCPEGFYEIVKDRPKPTPTGKDVLWFRYELTGDGILRKHYFCAPVPRRFSRLSIYLAITNLGAWDTIQTWLESKTIDGVNGWIAFQIAQDISESHPLFATLSAEAKEMLGLSDEQFEEILKACVLVN